MLKSISLNLRNKESEQAEISVFAEQTEQSKIIIIINIRIISITILIITVWIECTDCFILTINRPRIALFLLSPA